ncbi:hypothetical protein [Candidatus Methanomassiliicoccus intestinalis]|uniref:hypothetical protein n=1 Tax=Candidatus Methanomassiliicoccus intestinalis TaxID=1406512 RepID=UPI0037DD352B
MNKKYLIISILIICIVLVAGVSILQHQNSSGDDDVTEGETFTFVDAKGYEHTISTPISNVSVVHKYIPIFMKILGVEDEVAGLDSTYGMTFSEYFKNSFPIGEYSEPDGATMISHGSKVILTPITMGLSNADALKEMGIEVIYIDLTDPYVIEENLELLVKLFGATEKIKSNFNKYMELFNECGDFVSQFNFDETKDKNFTLFMASSGFYHTHASAAVKVIESISGKSYTHIIDPNVKDTVYFYQDPSVLVDFDGKHTLDYMFIYTMDTPQQNYQKFLTSGKDIDYTQLTCIKTKNTYSISTDCVNGALSCISQILYADAFGADVGDKAVEMIQKFNDAFGLQYSTNDLIVEVA